MKYVRHIVIAALNPLVFAPNEQPEMTPMDQDGHFQI